MCKALKFVTFLIFADENALGPELGGMFNQWQYKNSDKPVKLIVLRKTGDLMERAWQCQCFPDLREAEEGEEFYTESKGRTMKKFWVKSRKQAQSSKSQISKN